MRMITDLNNDWLFVDSDIIGAQGNKTQDTDWAHVTIPHDWAINSKIDPPEDFLEADLIHPSGYRWKAWQGFFDRYGVGWYRNHISFTKAERHFIEFDGVFHECDVYLNGQFLGHHHYGYTSFNFEVTDYVKEEDNVLAIRVDNSFEHLSDRWYSGCGIYRPVKIISTDKTRIKRHGIIINDTEITNDVAKISVEVNLDGKVAKGDKIKAVLYNESGIAAEHICKASAQTRVAISIQNPKLWSTENPNLYNIDIDLIVDDNLADRESLRYGFRKIDINAKEGIKLNGEKVDIKGVNLHHDLGALGTAWNKQIARKRLNTLKEIGCNSIRTAHNPPAKELLDLCDEMGFLVIEEVFDKWETLRYGLIYDKCWQDDLTEMIMRDLNHPCVFCWSVGNEVNNQAKDDMLERLKNLTTKARQLDSSRPITYAMEPHVFDSAQQSMTPAQKAGLVQKIYKHVDIVCGNYQEHLYAEYHKLMPEMVYIGGEAYAFFHNDIHQNPAFTDKNPWLDVLENDFVLGQYLWPGIDYLGEAIWPSRMWSSGVIDSTSHIKEIGYLTKSLWSDRPVVHMSIYDDSLKNMKENSSWGFPPMAGHWNYEHKSRPYLKAFIFTNCDKVSLTINSKLVKYIDTSFKPKGYIETYVPNTPGEVVIAGYIDDKIVSCHRIQTATKPSNIELKLLNDYDNIDIAMVEAKVVDKQGVLCPHFDETLTFLSDNLKFIAADSGDTCDHTPFASNTRHALGGRCIAYFKVNKEISGKITVLSEDMSASINLKTFKESNI